VFAPRVGSSGVRSPPIDRVSRVCLWPWVALTCAGKTTASSRLLSRWVDGTPVLRGSGPANVPQSRDSLSAPEYPGTRLPITQARPWGNIREKGRPRAPDTGDHKLRDWLVAFSFSYGVSASLRTPAGLCPGGGILGWRWRPWVRRPLRTLLACSTNRPNNLEPRLGANKFLDAVWPQLIGSARSLLGGRTILRRRRALGTRAGGATARRPPRISGSDLSGSGKRAGF